MPSTLPNFVAVLINASKCKKELSSLVLPESSPPPNVTQQVHLTLYRLRWPSLKVSRQAGPQNWEKPLAVLCPRAADLLNTYHL